MAQAAPKKTAIKTATKTKAAATPAASKEPNTADDGKGESQTPPSGTEQKANEAFTHVLVGSDAFPAEVETVDGKVLLGDIVAAAHKASGLSVEDWNELGQLERDERIGAEIEQRQPAADVEKPTATPPIKPAPAAIDDRANAAEQIGGDITVLTTDKKTGRKVAVTRPLEARDVLSGREDETGCTVLLADGRRICLGDAT